MALERSLNNKRDLRLHSLAAYNPRWISNPSSEALERIQQQFDVGPGMACRSL